VKNILIGVLIGIFLCVSFFEFIHLTVEVEGQSTCSAIYDSLTKKWHPDFVYQLRIVYKVFAIPVKTFWVSLSDDEVAISRGFGYRGCFGNWVFKKYGLTK